MPEYWANLFLPALELYQGTQRYLSVLDDVVEQLSPGHVLHDHEDVRRGGDDLESKRFFYFKKLTENAETVLD